MGVMIVSLDCEGKWGMADRLEPYLQAQLTDRALADVYDRLVALFTRYDIPATFAYVMAFTLTESERKDLMPLLSRTEIGVDPWLRYYWEDVEAGRNEGWFQPHALDVVKDDGRHEIACHSFCHRPMGDRSLSADGARAELQAAAKVAAMKSVGLETFVFPRNEIGNLAVLREAGYIGYREKLARPNGKLGRLLGLLEELNIRPSLQRGGKASGVAPLPIPPGYFFNWRFGARKLIPPALTVARWKNLLDRTAELGGVAHLWLHPHNLITAPSTAKTLEAVLAHAAALREQGRLTIQTQETYARAELGNL